MKKILRPLAILVVAVMMMTAVVGCGGDTTTATVTISKTTATMTAGDTLILTATSSDDAAITWSSDKDDVATVVDGTVTAVKAGTAVITAKTETASAQCTITVNKKEGSLVLGMTAMQLDIGEEKALEATSTDLEGSASFVSSSPSVATVSSEGVVKGVTFGTTTITVTHDGKTATCDVVVSDVKLSANKLTLDIGNSKQLSILSQYPTTPVGVFVSKDSAVVSTTTEGLLSADAVGITSVTVQVGASKGICEVEVVDRSQYKIIATVEDFKNMKNDPTGKYILVNDINFEDAQLTKFTTTSNEFSGIFDGNGYTLSNLRIGQASPEGDGSYNDGLFGYINKDGIIRNVNINGASIVGGSFTSLFGDRNRGLIENIFVRNSSLTGSKYWNKSLGGIIAKNEGTIRNCILDFSISVVNPAAGPAVSIGVVTGCNHSSGNVGIVENCIVASDLIYEFGIVGVLSTDNDNTVPSPDATQGTVTNCKSVELADFKKAGTFAEYNFENFNITDKEWPKVQLQTKPILMAKQSISMTETKSFQIAAYTFDDTKPSYKSEDETIVTVDANGLVTALKVGNTDITLSKVVGDRTFSVVIDVEVVELPPVLNMDERLVLPKTATTQNIDLEILVKGEVFAPPADEITWESSNTSAATIANGVLTVVKPGTFTTITATYKNVSASCIVTIEGNAYEADFSTMEDSATLPEGYKISASTGVTANVEAEINGGFLDIKSKTDYTNTILMLPEGIVGDTDEYYVDFEFAYVSQRHLDRYIGFKYRQNPDSPTKDFFQYAIRSTAMTNASGIMFSRNKGGVSNNTICTRYTEDLVVNKIYTARIYAKGERSIYYLNGMKMVEGTTEGYNVVGKELGIEVASANFKIKKIAVNYGKPDAEIIVSETPISVNAKASTTIKANSSDPMQTLAWSSADETVAKVDQNGVVTGVAGGKTTITIKAGVLEKTIEVTVVDPTVSFKESTVKVGIGAEASKQLELLISFKAISSWGETYSSDNEAVATVSADGVVTGITAGTATITATVGKIKAVCTVTVIEGQEIEMPDSMEIMPNVPKTLEAKLFINTSTVEWSMPENDIMTYEVDATDSKKVTITGLKVGEVVLTATCDGKQKSITIKVGVYKMDFTNMADGDLPEGYVTTSSTTAANVTATVKDGFLDIGTANGTNGVVMFPEGIVGDDTEYYVDIEFAYVSQHVADRYIGFKFRQNPDSPTKDFFQYAIRSTAMSHATTGIMFSRNKTVGGADNSICTKYTEDLVVNKIYTARIHANVDNIICYLDGTKTVEGNTEGYNVVGKELGVEVSSSNFKIKSITVKLGAPTGAV